MIIREMVLEDLGEVGNLAEQLGYPCTSHELAERFQGIQGDSNVALFVATDESAKVVAYMQINRECQSLLAAPRAEVAALVVDQNERGRGIGAQLLQHAELWAKKNSLSLIRVRSNIKRTDAHRFYRKCVYENPKSWHLCTKNIK